MPRAVEVANTACVKLVHYEARVQAIITYCTRFEQRKVKKEVARNMRLTREQFLQINIEHYQYLLFLRSSTLHLIFLHVMYLMTCMCLRGG